MSELTLRFGEARLRVEGDADLVARERAVFLEHLGRLDRQSEKAGELLAVLLRAGHTPEKAEEPVSKKAEPEEPAEEKSVTQDDLCRLRSIHVGFISPSQLKRAKAEGKLDHLLDKRDEIEVPLDTGGTVTVVCCYVTPTSARFVFKDCWDEGVMNDEATNKTGYFKSKGRKHVLEDIYPHIAAEWREIIVPRTFVETIEGERVNHHSIRRPGRFLHGRGFTAALPRLHEQPLCSYFKPLRQTTQVREVMRPANRAPDRTLYGWDTALEAT